MFWSHLKTSFILLVFVFLPEVTCAQTMRWAVQPSSAHIEDYGRLLKVRKGGKTGLFEHNGQEVVAVKYDSITAFRNGYSLVMNYRGYELKIEGVIAENDNEMQPLTEDEIYATQFAWFSEGLMPVKSSSGWGYLDTGGNISIPCQFEEAYPFSEGWAAVKIDEKAYYIDRNMNFLSVGVGEGNLAFTSTFSGGEAVVYSRNMKGYVINRMGRKVRNYNVKPDKVEVNADYSIGDKAQGLQKQVQKLPVDDRFSVFEENGRFGYMCGDKIILPAQLDRAEPVRGGYASAWLKGKSGVLQVVEGDIAATVTSPSIEVEGGRVTSAGQLRLSLPEIFDESPVRLRMTDAEGHDFVVSSTQPDGSQGTYTFSPNVIPDSSGNAHCKLEIWGENLLLSSYPCDISYNVTRTPVISENVAERPKPRPARVSLGKIWPKGKRALPNNVFTVAVSLKNSGEMSGDVQVAMSVNGKSYGSKNVSVKGNGQSQAVFTIPNVKKPYSGKVVVKIVGSGDNKEAIIDFEPFY